MSTARAMSVNRRAFHALAGKTFPHVGKRGRYIHQDISLRGDGKRPEADVEVVSVTVSGKTVTVRFVDKWARKHYGIDAFRVYRRGEGCDGSGWYLPHGRFGPPGEVVFSAAMATRPWRLK